MRDADLAANSIKSYTRTLKSFLSWCNEAGITRLNIPLYKAEETIKETYSDEDCNTEKAVKEARHEEMRLSRISELGNYQSLTQ